MKTNTKMILNEQELNQRIQARAIEILRERDALMNSSSNDIQADTETGVPETSTYEVGDKVYSDDWSGYYYRGVVKKVERFDKDNYQSTPDEFYAGYRYSSSPDDITWDSDNYDYGDFTEAKNQAFIMAKEAAQQDADGQHEDADSDSERDEDNRNDNEGVMDNEGTNHLHTYMTEAAIVRAIDNKVNTILQEGSLSYSDWMEKPKNQAYHGVSDTSSILKYHQETHPTLITACSRIVSSVMQQIDKKLPVVVYTDRFSPKDGPTKDAAKSAMIETVIKMLSLQYSR